MRRDLDSLDARVREAIRVAVQSRHDALLTAKQVASLLDRAADLAEAAAQSDPAHRDEWSQQAAAARARALEARRVSQKLAAAEGTG